MSTLCASAGRLLTTAPPSGMPQLAFLLCSACRMPTVHVQGAVSANKTSVLGCMRKSMQLVE
jgi:hypothetical protein